MKKHYNLLYPALFLDMTFIQKVIRSTTCHMGIAIFTKWNLQGNITFIRFVKNPLTDMTINIPMNSKDIYCKREDQKRRLTTETKYY